MFFRQAFLSSSGEQNAPAEAFLKIYVFRNLANQNSNIRSLGSGKHSIKVSYRLGLGCMGMSWNRSFIPERKYMIAVIRKAYDMGVNLFDTAEGYGPFRNEEPDELNNITEAISKIKIVGGRYPVKQTN